MKKLLPLLLIFIVVTGCSNDENDKSKTESETSSAVERNTLVESELNEVESSPVEKGEKHGAQTDVTSDKSESIKKVNLTTYRPQQGTTKIFLQNNQYETEYEITAVQEDHLQRVITFGGMVTLQILNWTKDEVAVVYEEENPVDTSNQIDTYTAINSPDLLIQINQFGDGSGPEWQIISTKKTLVLPYGEVENVLAVKKTYTSENSADKTIFTSYFAPSIGLVKEVIEVTGENGYTATSELKEIKYEGAE